MIHTEKDRQDRLRLGQTDGQTGRQEGSQLRQALGGQGAANQQELGTALCHMQ